MPHSFDSGQSLGSSCGNFDAAQGCINFETKGRHECL